MITAEEMSKFGLGTKNLDEETDDNGTDGEAGETPNTLQEVYRGGINTFDTSPISGEGKSEMKIGNFMEHEHCRENVFLSSKCGYHYDLESELTRDTSRERLQQELGESMNRLKVNVIDLYLLNAPPNGEDLDSSVYTLDQMQHDRNIRNIGLKDPSLAQLKQSLRIAPLDFVQIPVNVFEENPINRFRPLCAEESVRIIACDLMGPNQETETSAISSDEAFSKTESSKFLAQFKNQLEDYFQEEFPDKSADEILATWSVQLPEVHSGIIEAGRTLKLKSILRILDITLSKSEFRRVREVLSSS